MTVPARLPLTGTPVAHVGHRCASLAAWATEFLRGTASADAIIRVVTGADEPHLVDGLPSGNDLSALLADLRNRKATGMRLILPIPGDPRGLPGPGPMSDAALSAGEAVRLQAEGFGYGLVPMITEHGTALDGHAVTVRWQLYECAGAEPEPAGTRRQAEHDLTEALRTATTTLTALDVARSSPETATVLSRARSARSPVVLPPGHPGTALWAQADRLAAIIDVAAKDDGGAYDRFGALQRRDVLRGLATAVRRAKTAAINARLDLPERDLQRLNEEGSR